MTIDHNRDHSQTDRKNAKLISIEPQAENIVLTAIENEIIQKEVQFIYDFPFEISINRLNPLNTMEAKSASINHSLQLEHNRGYI